LTNVNLAKTSITSHITL